MAKHGSSEGFFVDFQSMIYKYDGDSHNAEEKVSSHIPRISKCVLDCSCCGQPLTVCAAPYASQTLIMMRDIVERIEECGAPCPCPQLKRDLLEVMQISEERLANKKANKKRQSGKVRRQSRCAHKHHLHEPSPRRPLSRARATPAKMCEPRSASRLTCRGFPPSQRLKEAWASLLAYPWHSEEHHQYLPLYATSDPEVEKKFTMLFAAAVRVPAQTISPTQIWHARRDAQYGNALQNTHTTHQCTHELLVVRSEACGLCMHHTSIPLPTLAALLSPLPLALVTPALASPLPPTLAVTNLSTDPHLSSILHSNPKPTSYITSTTLPFPSLPLLPPSCVRCLRVQGKSWSMQASKDLRAILLKMWWKSSSFDM